MLQNQQKFDLILLMAIIREVPTINYFNTVIYTATTTLFCYLMTYIERGNAGSLGNILRNHEKGDVYHRYFEMGTYLRKEFRQKITCKLINEMIDLVNYFPPRLH